MLLGILLGCTPATDRIDPVALAEGLKTRPSDFYIVDVRMSYEFNGGHLPGAHSMPYPGVMWNADDLAPKAGQTVVLVCLSGHRSRLPMNTIRTQFPNVTVVDLEGGMQAWRAQGRGVEW